MTVAELMAELEKIPADKRDLYDVVPMSTWDITRRYATVRVRTDRNAEYMRFILIGEDAEYVD
jgi:hypothetical protein